MPFCSSSRISRRSVLQFGSLCLGGLGLSDLLRLRADAATQGTAAQDTSIILLWLEGGPSHLETYDLKPEAPAEYRGEFRPIPTSVPGLDLCEYLPQHARVADRFNLLRSVSHNIADHPGAAALFLSGRRPRIISDVVSKYPTFESVVAKMRSGRTSAVPPYVSNVRQLKGGGSAYLGQTCEPFVVDADPNAPDFQVENIGLDAALENRLDDRTYLLQAFDRLRRDLDSSGAMEAGDRFQQRALQLLASGRTRDAFDIRQEPDAVRDRYGRNEWGQRTLLARRLIEAGCSFVTVQLQTYKAAVTWDDHGDGGAIFNNMKIRLPIFDQTVSALIEDIYARGLDRRVMVIVTGEFGRAPRISSRPSRPNSPGRDHWSDAMSILVSGGGMRTGQVIGSTTSKGEMPVDRRFGPTDFLASVYRYLGIDPGHSFLDRQGRPMPILPEGTPIPELAAT